MIFRSLAIIAALIAAPAASAQQGDEIRGLRMVRVTDPTDGAFACSLAFQILRPASADKPFRAISGSITPYITVSDVQRFTIKLTYSDMPRVFLPPARAFLVNADGKGTDSEELLRSIGETGEFALFDFSYGPKSQRAIARLANAGTAELRVRAPDGTQEDWALDLSGNPGVQREWVACMAEQGFPILD